MNGNGQDLRTSVFESGAVLAVVENPGLVETLGISHRHFADPHNRRIVKAIEDLQADWQSVDIASIVEKATLGTNHDPAQLATDLLTKIRDGFATVPSALPSHLEKLRDAAERRRFLERLKQAEFIAMDESADIADARAVLESDDDQTAKTHLEFVTSACFANSDYVLNYHIPGWLVAEQPGILFGPQKSLKTTIAIELNIALATGTAFLGRFPVTSAIPCGLATGESGAATVQETAIRIAAARGFDLADIRNLFWCFTVPDLRRPNAIVDLRRVILRHGLRVLVVDPLYMMNVADPDQASNLYAMGAGLAPLLKLGADTGCAIILAHHARKTRKDPYVPLTLEDMAFAGVQEFCRQYLMVNRRCPYNSDNGGEHELWLGAGGSAGHSQLWGLNVSEGTRQTPGGRFWQVELLRASELAADEAATDADRKRAREEARTKALADKYAPIIVDALRTHPEGRTAKSIKEERHINTAGWGAAISYLLHSKQVVPCKVTAGNRQTYEGYTLTENEHRDSSGLTETHRDYPSDSDEHDTQWDSPPIGGVPVLCVSEEVSESKKKRTGTKSRSTKPKRSSK